MKDCERMKNTKPLVECKKSMENEVKGSTCNNWRTWNSEKNTRIIDG